MNISGCTLHGVLSREKIDELCCLYTLGELAPEQIVSMEAHLRECRQCRTLMEDFERIVLFDLPCVQVVRTEGSTAEDPELVDAGKILAKVRERARLAREEYSASPEWQENADSAPALKWRVRFIRPAQWTALAAGWLIAAALLSYHFTSQPRPEKAAKSAQLIASQQQKALAVQAARVSQQLQLANATVKALEVEVARDAAHNRSAQFEMARLKAQYQDAAGSNAGLNIQLKRQEGLLAQESAELQLTRDSLNAEMASKTALEGQLADVYGRLDKQRQEVATLARVAAAVPAAYPVSETKVSEGEAREILGARDLHIVDVYDVDDSGAATHAYGRIYYVNHRALVFYAFDLSKQEKNHKLVAFQAWGFRQPRSSNVESLGLFYLDNATLNRWALRISNPEILSRIDTLFVTVEPPGGSPFPKGRRLLMASLAGPPNHP